MPRDSSPSGSVLAVNHSIRVVSLPTNSRVPVTYTLTVTGSPTVGATTVSFSVTPAITAAAPLIIDDFIPLKFGANTVTPKTGSLTSFTQVFTTGSTVAVLCQPLTAVPTGNTTSRSLTELLGIQNLDFNRNSNLISIRSQKSGLGNEQRATQISYEFSVSGWVHQRDWGYQNVIKPIFNSAGELFAEVEFNDGSLISGIFGISNLTNPIQLDQVMQQQYTLFCQGLPTETVLP